MNDQWTDRLSEYVDGTLIERDRDALEDHLAGCAACREVLRDLRGVVERARGLEARAPARDLWSGIARRIGATAAHRSAWARRRFSFTLPQLAAAAVVLILLAAATVSIVFSGRGPETAGADSIPVPGITPRVVPVTTPRLDAAVTELEEALRAGRGRLDSTTVRVIEQNLAIIDRAIAEALRALERDPANSFLNRHLTNQKLRKLDLLRRANELAAART